MYDNVSHLTNKTYDEVPNPKTRAHGDANDEVVALDGSDAALEESTFSDNNGAGDGAGYLKVMGDYGGEDEDA